MRAYNVVLGALLPIVQGFDCSAFNCTCQGFQNYYNGVSRKSWGCAPVGEVRTWYMDHKCHEECDTQGTACQAEEGVIHRGCGEVAVPWGPKASASPTDFGWTLAQFKTANTFINQHVIQRQCLIVAKDGKIVYELYQNGGTAKTLFEGWSMTKSVGAFLVLMAASQGQLDLDADITKVYGVPSSKEYGLTTRMILTQIISSDDAPGMTWEYDSLGTKWLYLLPRILERATDKHASGWFQELKRRAEFTIDFTWEEVERDWHSGAKGPCYDWARFAQILASGGKWGNDQILSPEVMARVNEPMKYPPFNYYSNTCWGHGFWINSDKQKFPGCCWEASRLPAPACNNETFIDGASLDLMMMLGLYGQVVMAVPSRSAVIVSMGRDLRPIEPVRLGVYPAFCEMLDLPCTTPPEVPKPRCDEKLECLGISAQCYAGLPSIHGFNHSHPEPGREVCKRCFEQRIMQWHKNDMVQPILMDNCKFGSLRNAFQDISEYIECFCFDGDDPFAWPSTSTTTPKPGHEHFPPKLYTTTTQPPSTDCSMPPSCTDAMHQACGVHDGANDCYICLAKWWPHQAQVYGCEIGNFGQEETIFCFCGTALPKSEANVPVQIIGLENHYSRAVSLSQAQAGKHVELCAADAGKVCEIGAPGMGYDLSGAVALAKRAAHHLLVTSVDKKVQLGVFSNWSHRVLQAFPLESRASDDSHCETWATTASSRVREFSDKEPHGTFAAVAGCNSADCCAAACCSSSTDCDTWTLSPTAVCYVGTATHYVKKAGWNGRSLDEALCSRDQHLYDKNGFRPVGGVKAHAECTDADCCQEICCDNKATCTDWAFGTDPTHTYHGCWIGKATYWTPEYGWVGASGRGLHPAGTRLAHTSSKFDGYYKLIVTSSGDIAAENVQPCTDARFPVPGAHSKPTNGMKAVADCESVACCQETCADTDGCTTWAFSKAAVPVCWNGKPTKFVYEPSWLSCAASSVTVETLLPDSDVFVPDSDVSVQILA